MKTLWNNIKDILYGLLSIGIIVVVILGIAWVAKLDCRKV